MVSFRAAQGIAKEYARNQPMGPGQSMAMAGNTGLAGFTENQAKQIKEGQEAINQFQGNTTEPVTYQSIGQQVGEMGSKYRRPVDYQRYADRMQMLNQGIAGGGKFFIGPDGIPRFSFMGMDSKPMDSSGGQFLSIMLPELTASAPTLSQLGGDISRAFTGYDSLKYPDQDFQGPFPLSKSPGFNARDLPYMQRTPGMFENIDPLSLIPGVGVAKKIAGGIQDIYQKGQEKVKQTFSLEDKMSAYEDPINFYNQKSEKDKPETMMVADAGNAAQNYMNLLKNVQNLGKTKYGDFGIEDIFSNPSLTYEKEIGPGTFSTKIGDNQVEAGYRMIFNKGGRVQGTGIMGAL